jgi:hypothetical protein
MIAYTFFFPWSPPAYVAQLPGEGGRDWGYTSDKAQAKLLSDYWWRRFAADQRAVARAAFAIAH